MPRKGWTICPHGPGILHLKMLQFGNAAAVARTIRLTNEEHRGTVTANGVRAWVYRYLPDIAPYLLKHGGNRNPEGIGGRGGKQRTEGKCKDAHK